MLSVIIYAQILLLAVPYVAAALAALLIGGICCGFRPLAIRRLMRRLILGLGHVVVRAAIRPWIRVVVDSGMGNTVPEGAVCICNHRSASDAFLVSQIRTARPAAQAMKGWPMRLPILGWCAKVGGYFSVDPRNVHAYVLGEHGETEFVAWSQAYLATKSLAEICDTSHGKFQKEPLYAIENEVRNSAQKIIQAKKATYYGIGLSLLRITRALLGDENSILTVSAALNGEYGESGVYAGVPCILNRQGIREVLVLPLNEKESAQMQHSCHTLRELSKNILI